MGLVEFCIRSQFNAYLRLKMIGLELKDGEPETLRDATRELSDIITQRGWDLSAYTFMALNVYDPVQKRNVRRLEATTKPFHHGVLV
jgi:hypothetical protein